MASRPLVWALSAALVAGSLHAQDAAREVDFRAPGNAVRREAPPRGRGDTSAAAIRVATLDLPTRVAQTIDESPNLYLLLRVPDTAGVSLVLTVVIGADTFASAWEARTGVHRLVTGDLGVRLRRDSVVTWTVTVDDLGGRLRQGRAVGQVQRVRPPDGLRDRLETASLRERIELFARHGLWYDLFDALTVAVETRRDDSGWDRARRDLVRKELGLRLP